ncbi:FAD dependent oxidoreductase [Aaosphaeria arxii CBS 175.79]|uniref:FAD dependent oxidoreductase n=1 Tax=Aaosphaeria arxii CBS 175.79 TaxID=1450172 RepID=A0A6A5XQI0_9PLEO|nr:FAD dependent oxidoreductase [Aaosphaeria arxii CBS 175.79]KAF2015422.1 FAD dependent oxidoreductase [Aaosphaeria arxii CBS 175.79]
MTSILIIGAGVIGLQTAVTLLEAGYVVTILAEHSPGDESIKYTSPWAGAIWRTHSAPHQVELCQWDMESYRTWRQIIRDEPGRAKDMGIEGRPIYVYSAATMFDTASPTLWFSSQVQNFSLVPAADLTPNCKSGYSYDSIVINPPVYLNYLASRARELGAQFVRARLPVDQGFTHAVKSAFAAVDRSEEEPRRDFAAVVNCTGLGAKELCQDESMYPIRGQTLLVRLTSTKEVVRKRIILQEDPAAAPAVTYCFPRPGTDMFLLGGTKKADDSSPEPDGETTKGIIARCRNVWPELRDAEIEVVSQQVGLRPGRKEGPRVEIEDVEIEHGRKVRVVHQYGHSGAGYQLSIGSAKKVLGLVRGILEA